MTRNETGRRFRSAKFYYGTAVLQNIIIEIETGHEKE